MESKDFVLVLITLIGASGWIGAIAAYRKSKPEAGKIFIDAAQGVVLMQTGVIGDLKKEVDFLRQENARILKENIELKKRMEEMEDKLKVLTRRTSAIEHDQHK